MRGMLSIVEDAGDTVVRSRPGSERNDDDGAATEQSVTATPHEESIQKEMEAKLAALRGAVIQSLQALQDQYTKAGKLDEAVAIRDYLKAGGPGSPSYRFLYWEKR